MNAADLLLFVYQCVCRMPKAKKTWEKNLWPICKPGPCAPELFLCLCGFVVKPVCSGGHVPLQTGWFCRRFVTESKVTCWAEVWQCYWVLPNVWSWDRSVSLPVRPSQTPHGRCISFVAVHVIPVSSVWKSLWACVFLISHKVWAVEIPAGSSDVCPGCAWAHVAPQAEGGRVLPLAQVVILALCFQEEVQNSFRRYRASFRSAGRRAETSYGQAKRQGTGQGSCDKLLIFPENFPGLSTHLQFLHSGCELRTETLPNCPGGDMACVHNQYNYLIAVWARCLVLLGACKLPGAVQRRVKAKGTFLNGNMRKHRKSTLSVSQGLM